MLSQYAMHQPFIGLGDDIIPEYITAKEPTEAQKDEEVEGGDFSGSLA